MVITAVSLFLVATLDVVATVMLLRSDFESRFQKRAQLLLVWALPIIGSITVIAVLKGASGTRGLDSTVLGTDHAVLPGSHGNADFSRKNSHRGDGWGEGDHGGRGGDVGHGGD